MRNYVQDYDSSDSDPEFYRCVSEKLGIRAVKGQNTSNILLPVYVYETKILRRSTNKTQISLLTAQIWHATIVKFPDNLNKN